MFGLRFGVYLLAALAGDALAGVVFAGVAFLAGVTFFAAGDAGFFPAAAVGVYKIKFIF